MIAIVGILLQPVACFATEAYSNKRVLHDCWLEECIAYAVVVKGTRTVSGRSYVYVNVRRTHSTDVSTTKSYSADTY